MKYSAKTKKYLLAFVSALSLGLSIENGWSAAQAQGNVGGNVNNHDNTIDIDGKIGRLYTLTFHNKKWYKDGMLLTINELYHILASHKEDGLHIISKMLDIQNYNMTRIIKHLIDHGHMFYLPINGDNTIRVPNRYETAIPRGIFTIEDSYNVRSNDTLLNYRNTLIQYLKYTKTAIINMLQNQNLQSLFNTLSHTNIQKAYKNLKTIAEQYAQKIFGDIFTKNYYTTQDITHDKKHDSIHMIVKPKSIFERETTSGWAFNPETKTISSTNQIMIYIKIGDGNKLAIASMFPI